VCHPNFLLLIPNLCDAALKIYNLNGHGRLPILKHKISDNEEWKDRSYGISPVFLNSSSHIPHKDGKY
jgi:hypothetical protein